jgi:succinate dehydrogenase / fumarate reductase, flavoprotein subunit
VSDADVTAATEEALAPLSRDGGESPYSLHSELQQTMNDLAGLIRRESELQQALKELPGLRARFESIAAPGGRAYNPGWHLAQDLRNMLLIAQCVAMAALERQESRGGHTREDFPAMSPEWRKLNLVLSYDGSSVSMKHQPIVPMRPDLLNLFDKSELKKYMTDEELAGVGSGSPAEEAH